MNETIKAIFFDLDGTLLSFKTHMISESTIDALKLLRAKGIKLFLATGRPPNAIAFLKSVFEFDAYVTTNGQYCYTPDELIYCLSFDRIVIQSLIELLKQFPFPCLLIEKSDCYINYIDDAVKDHCRLTNQPLPKVRDLKHALQRDIYQFVAYLDSKNEYILVNNLKQIQPTRAVPVCLDVMPLGGGKAAGIEAVLNHFGLCAYDTLAFGDGLNDIDMLNLSRIGIAMGNSAKEVIEIADYVTDDADHDGIRKALLKLEII